MRIVIHGVGAIGGVLLGALTQAGIPALGIARGARLAALTDRGLLLRTPAGADRVGVDCVAAPAEVAWRPDDMILLTTKTQDTEAALADLRAAGVTEQALFCVQNGIENERLALRSFPNVHAVNVMMPAEYMADDEAVAFGDPNLGVYDLGRYPSGTDAADAALAAALTSAGVAGFATADTMVAKRGKLLLNLGNVVEAALGRDAAAPDVYDALRDEGRAVFRTAGLDWREASDDARRDLMKITPVDGAPRFGSSTTQSLAKRSGRVETDWLNGEIVLIARLAGTEAPLNAAAARMGAALAAGRAGAGTMTPDAVRHALGLPGAG